MTSIRVAQAASKSAAMRPLVIKSKVDKHVLEINPVAAPVVRHIFDLRLQG